MGGQTSRQEHRCRSNPRWPQDTPRSASSSREGHCSQSSPRKCPRQRQAQVTGSNTPPFSHSFTGHVAQLSSEFQGWGHLQEQVDTSQTPPCAQSCGRQTLQRGPIHDPLHLHLQEDSSYSPPCLQTDPSESAYCFKAQTHSQVFGDRVRLSGQGRDEHLVHSLPVKPLGHSQEQASLFKVPPFLQTGGLRHSSVLAGSAATVSFRAVDSFVCLLERNRLVDSFKNSVAVIPCGTGVAHVAPLNPGLHMHTGFAQNWEPFGQSIRPNTQLDDALEADSHPSRRAVVTTRMSSTSTGQISR